MKKKKRTSKAMLANVVYRHNKRTAMDENPAFYRYTIYPLPIHAKTHAGHSILWNCPSNIHKLHVIPPLETLPPASDRNFRKYKTLY